MSDARTVADDRCRTVGADASFPGEEAAPADGSHDVKASSALATREKVRRIRDIRGLLSFKSLQRAIRYR
jgi:hypothetical protein